MAMDFRKYLEKNAEQLNRGVKQILKEQSDNVGKTDKKLIPLLKAFTKTCGGGKGIRGMLVKLGYQLSVSFWQAKRVQNPDSGVIRLWRTPQNDIIKIAAAYEIIHNAILAHDDIIDQSVLRRNQPSLYQALGGNHYGISQTISLADYGFFLSFKIISETNFSDQNKIKAIKLFAEIMMDTGLGEMLDLEETNILTIVRLKTARYTVSGPLKLGAVLAGAGQKLLEDLDGFGENLGIAFQIKDDILDKETNLWGGINCAKKKMERYRNQAMKVIPEITKDPKLSKLLEQLGEYLVERTK